MKILFVCLGNICRSPLADGILREKVKKFNLEIEVDSAGTSNLHAGEAPDKRMIATAKKFGTDISFLRARQFAKSDFKNYDLIYVMDKSNFANVSNLTTNIEELKKLKLILAEFPTDNLQEVPDPYYGTQADFDYVYRLLDKITNKIIEKIK